MLKTTHPHASDTQRSIFQPMITRASASTINSNNVIALLIHQIKHGIENYIQMQSTDRTTHNRYGEKFKYKKKATTLPIPHAVESAFNQIQRELDAIPATQYGDISSSKNQIDAIVNLAFNSIPSFLETKETQALKANLDRIIGLSQKTSTSFRMTNS